MLEIIGLLILCRRRHFPKSPVTLVTPVSHFLFAHDAPASDIPFPAETCFTSPISEHHPATTSPLSFHPGPESLPVHLPANNSRKNADEN